MAYYQSFTFTTGNQLIDDLKAFAEANGWTVDLHAVYLTSYKRLHIHQGGAHFDFYSQTSTQISCFGCTGFDGGLAPSAQPGASSAAGFKVWVGVVGYSGWLVSTVGGLYLSLLDANLKFRWGCVFSLSSKIGAWTEGYYVQGMATDANFLGQAAYASAAGYAQLYYNGGWSSGGIYAGSVAGVGSITGSGLQLKQPNEYNGGLLPVPVLMTLRHATDASKQYPLGYAPGVYKANGGNIYSVGDIITIDSDDYILLPYADAAVGHVSYGDLLFKLGA